MHSLVQLPLPVQLLNGNNALFTKYSQIDLKRVLLVDLPAQIYLTIVVAHSKVSQTVLIISKVWVLTQFGFHLSLIILLGAITATGLRIGKVSTQTLELKLS